MYLPWQEKKQMKVDLPRVYYLNYPTQYPRMMVTLKKVISVFSWNFFIFSDSWGWSFWKPLKAVQSEYIKKKKSSHFTLKKWPHKVLSDTEFFIFLSWLAVSISVEDWARWHSALSKARLHDVLCFSKYWSPLLRGFLYASSVTWHSAYPRNPETAASMLICLYILRNFIYGLTSVTLLRKLIFKCLMDQRITGDQPACPWPYQFFSLFPLPITQLTNNTRTSIVLLTSPRLTKIIHSYLSLTDTKGCVHDAWRALNCFHCGLSPVGGAAACHCGNTL